MICKRFDDQLNKDNTLLEALARKGILQSSREHLVSEQRRGRL